jgi:hypothetical protein
MIKTFLTFSVALLIMTGAGVAGDLPKTQVSTILENKAVLSLTEAQVKKLERVERNAQEKMLQARAQADIRMTEVEKFTGDWDNMNGIAVLELVKEYFKYMTEYKTAEVEAIIQARAILESEQLAKFQQLASIQSLMVKMEQNLAVR